MYFCLVFVDFTIREMLSDPSEVQQFLQNMSIPPSLSEELLNTTVNTREVMLSYKGPVIMQIIVIRIVLNRYYVFNNYPAKSCGILACKYFADNAIRLSGLKAGDFLQD